MCNFWSGAKTRFIKKSLWADTTFLDKLRYEIFASLPIRFTENLLDDRDSSQVASYRVQICSDKEISEYQTVGDEKLRRLNANLLKSCADLFEPYSGPKPDITADLILSSTDDSEGDYKFEDLQTATRANDNDTVSDEGVSNNSSVPPASSSHQSDDDHFISKPSNTCARPNVIVSSSDSEESDDDDFVATSASTLASSN